MNKPDNDDYRRYTSKSEEDKALNTLKGILEGITIDNVIEDDELIELHEWCEINKHLLTREIFNEFLSYIQELIETKEERRELIEDIRWLCDKIPKHYKYYDDVTAKIQILQGICHGILADGKVTDEEIIGLRKWLENNDDLISYYPYDEINSILLSVLSNKVIDETERKKLTAYLNDFVSIANEKISSQLDTIQSDINLSGLCTSDPKIEFEGKTFCFTGKSARFSKKEFEDIINSMNGIFTDRFNEKIDYLIVASNGNPSWAFSCYGRKVESAMKMRKEGKNISIINEFDFLDCYEDSK